MRNKYIQLFWQFWNQWLRFRYVDPAVSFARLLVTVGVGLSAPSAIWWLCIEFGIGPFKLPPEIRLSFRPEKPIFIGLCLIVIGVILGIWGLKKIKRSRSASLIYLRGMPGMKESPPVEDLPAKYRHGEVKDFVINTQILPPHEALDEIKILKKILDKGTFSANTDAPSLFFAGLAPVPILYAIGTIISSRKNTYIMDYNRFSQKWHLLDELDDEERIIEDRSKLSDPIEFAVVLPITTGINLHHLPDKFQSNAIWFNLNTNNPRTDAVSSEDKLTEIIRCLHDFFRNIRSQDGFEDLNRIHLYIAAQASTVVRLGMFFQANAYPEIRIYQYDPNLRKHTWSVSINKEEILFLNNNSKK